MLQDMRLEVLTALKIQVTAFCVVTPCSDVRYQRFRDCTAFIFR